MILAKENTVPYNIRTMKHLSVSGSTMKKETIEYIFVPTLQTGNIVIFDHGGITKGKKVQVLIEAHGGKLIFLPTSFSDGSPIEEAFSLIKAVVQVITVQLREDVYKALEDCYNC